jgi:3-keto-disaccharide hydrolase
MRRALSVGVLGLGVLAGSAVLGEEGFVKLYNGKDLGGWHVQSGKLEAWKANGEMISSVSPGGGYLTSDKQYGDFELRLEYRIPPRGNSGIGIRYPPGGHPSTAGMEIQLLDDDAPQYKNLKPSQFNGSIYKLVAPKARAAKPAGEWNKLAIRCQGPMIVIHLNGTEIQKVNADEHTTAEGDLVPLARRPRKGCIGLQSHGDPVDFRGLEIKEL